MSRNRTFGALSVYNYRLYITGQAVSQSGTWLQRTAQAWLVLELTNSAVALLSYREGVEAFRVTDRLSDAERETLMGGALTRIYRWAPSS